MIGVVYGLAAEGMFVKAELNEGALCRPNAGFVQVRTALLPMRCSTSGIGDGVTEFELVTEANESPILKSSMRMVAPNPDP